MKQKIIPLYDALINHLEHRPISFHVPGHKYGTLLNQDTGAYFANIMKLDATELSGLDDLHSPEGPIAEAEQLLTELYQVEKSFFLVNGSTVGNLAMVLATSSEGGRFLVQRNCHKSIVNALRLANAEPVFIEPEYNGEWKVAAGLTLEAVQDAITACRGASGLILTYPNYYGMADSIKEIIQIAHANGIPVLVDEAHGAHFIAGQPFPPSAITLGADLVVQSAHKTLPAMTMGSFLHFNSKLVKLSRVKDNLQMLQSSSPSYPIMASLDLARSYLGTFCKKDVDFLTGQIDRFRAALAHIPQIRVLEYKGVNDPLKVTIQSACHLNGFEIQQLLEQEGIFSELADPHNVLFVLPLLKEGMSYPFSEAAEKIAAALKKYPVRETDCTVSSSGGGRSKLALSYQEMDKLKPGRVLVEKAEGSIAAETIIPYPPGIPLVLKGELITAEMAESLANLRNAGARFQGGERLENGEILIYKRG
ncbi:aminotransferase class I/II-fold pyridoxal phosphate-dependent enzyme [Neobacillus notoginsengisoli]|uniref:Aminotransferase class I/II-fold pyridoxal phosphate-dependent enzyme n=1 Tax=Neobacillus notoginsengisoli TaxID=1578198 RepID=A0A417YGA3_9BACI|nr:aminotransferase class I/II-fold pyridoxal phosphate-dependent enzyme [Neobacillus notoginsengisoli]RHW31782.1 aminotransferase class I/II-fold pyridoxal phosphate-dependent enzyme [Neobacillus notoginsengisoli]